MNPLPSKKQKFAEEDSLSSEDSDVSLNDDNEEDDSGGSEGDTPADGIVNVDFEGLPPEEEDYDSIRRLLDQLFRGLLISSSQLSDLIIQTQEFSTVLKDQNTEEPAIFAVASVINLSNPFNHVALETAMGFRSSVLASYKEGSDADLKKFQVGGNSHEAVFGLVVLEKIVNIPEQVAWQMLTTLKEDIDLAEAKFSHFFMLTKRYRVGEDTHPVEEYFDYLQDFSSLKIDLDLPDNVDTIQHNAVPGIPFRRLLLFKATDFFQAIQTKTGT